MPPAWQGPWPAPFDGLSGSQWQGFADPLLPQLVDEALRANTELRSARSALERARALRDLAAAGQSVALGSSGRAGRSRSGGQTADSLRLGLDASWEADLFGAQAAGVAAAQADAEAAAATLQATRLAVAAETALTYIAWQGARHQMAVAERSLDGQRQTLQLVQARVSAGLATPLELDQAGASFEQTRARLPVLRHSSTQAEHALAILLAQPPGALAARLATAPSALPRVPELPAPELPASWLQRRPDLRAAELKAGAALATLEQRRAERRPRFTISGNLALQAATWSALGGTGALVAGLATAVDWAVLDGGAGRAQVAAQQAALESARIAWHAAVLSALQDVEDSLSALATGREREAMLTRAGALADEGLVLARHRWQAGLADYATVLDAERTALTAADSLAAARTELASSHIRLLKALGGGIGVAASESPAATRTS